MQEKVALVTGAGRGIGRGIALELAAAGYAVVANYRQDAEAAAGLQRAILERGGTCELARGDVARSAAADSVGGESQAPA